MEPRAVLIHRATELDGLMLDHGTKGKAAFFLKSRGGDLAEIEHRHQLQHRVMGYVLKGLPSKWRRAMVERSDLVSSPDGGMQARLRALELITADAPRTGRPASLPMNSRSSGRRLFVLAGQLGV
jgi:hypothetical protein